MLTVAELHDQPHYVMRTYYINEAIHNNKYQTKILPQTLISLVITTQI